MRLDADLLAWFRRERGYQTRINAILRAYMKAHASAEREFYIAGRSCLRRRPARSLMAGQNYPLSSFGEYGVSRNA
jgi:hypothetical protein